MITTIQLQLIIDDLIDLEDSEILTDENEEGLSTSEILFLNPLEIVEKYSHRAKEQEIVSEIKIEEWRNNIPIQVQLVINNWETATLEEVYDTAKERVTTIFIEQRISLY